MDGLKTPKPNKAAGFTLTEALIALALAGVLAAFTIPKLLNLENSTKWGKITEDYLHHLSASYNAYNLKNGLAIRNSGNTDGFAGYLPTFESVATHDAASPENLSYPGELVVYLKPEQVVGDPVLAGTENRDWLLLDLNGSASPNSLTSGGDRVLIYIDNDSGRVLTGHQQDSGTFAESFYDDYKGY